MASHSQNLLLITASLGPHGEVCFVNEVAHLESVVSRLYLSDQDVERVTREVPGQSTALERPTSRYIYLHFQPSQLSTRKLDSRRLLAAAVYIQRDENWCDQAVPASPQGPSYCAPNIAFGVNYALFQ